MLHSHVLGILLPLVLLTPVGALVQRHRFPEKRGGARNPSLVQLPIDHFGDYNGTFQNRYWYNDIYYKAGGPVFLYDVGETNAEDTSFELLEDGTHTPVVRLAKRYNGVGVIWEHRYYGESLPFPVNENTAAEEWQYLTVEQALEDVVAFSKIFAIPHPDNRTAPYRPHPSSTPWIFIGASYPGARAAFIRIRNPEIIYASWSSSGPVQAQVEMPSYWQQAQRNLPTNCSNDWIAVTKYVDDVLMNGSEQEIFDLKTLLIKAKFSGPGGNTTIIDQDGLLSTDSVNAISAGEAAGFLMDPLGSFQYYGVEPVIPFCDAVETINFTSPAYGSGLSETFGIRVALLSFLVGIAETSPDVSAVVHPPAPPEQATPDNLSWMYQFCSEFGFFPGADPYNNKSVQTTFQTFQDYQDSCFLTFPKGLPPSPAVDKILGPYGGWHMNPTHVMFTNGEYDPWRTLSIASFEYNAPYRIGSSAIPQCHTAPDPSSYFGVVYRGREHGSDLGSPIGEPLEPFYTSLSLFEMALDEWLPCF